MSRILARITFLSTSLFAAMSTAMAGVTPPASAPAAASVPALSEWSLLALLPLIGVLAYRSKKKTDHTNDDPHGKQSEDDSKP